MTNKGLTFVKLHEHSDQRGRMRIVEVESGLPFVPVRSFIISDVPSDQSRAGHAVSCDELLIVAQGSCLITARTGAGLEEHASERYEETRFFDEYVDLERLKKG
jgi:hypothetical protein